MKAPVWACVIAIMMIKQKGVYKVMILPSKLKTPVASTQYNHSAGPGITSLSGKAASVNDTALPDAAAITVSLSQKAVASYQNPASATNNQTDAGALLTTADGALDRIQSLLLRSKELAVQAMQTDDADKKQSLQNQLTKITQEIDAISASAKYEDANLFVDSNSLSENDQKIIKCLKSGWLEEAEKVVEDRYGLTADDAPLKLVLEETPQPYLAAIEYHYGPDGKATDEILHIAVDTALPASLPNGGQYPYYDDRIIAHEMVHAIMGRSMNFASLPVWFKEGTAEFVHGANERVAIDLARNGGGIEGATAIQNALGDGTDASWNSDSLHYSSATMAVRYLHEQIQAAGHSGGIKDLLADLKNNPTEDLDQALSHVSNYADTKAFITDFVTKGNGAAFIHSLEKSCELAHTLLGGDTGGIGGASVDGGPEQTATSVIPDIYYPSEQPLKHYNIIWPIVDEASAKSILLTNTRNNTVSYSPFKIDSKVLNLTTVDLVNAPGEAVDSIDNAISYVSKGQTYISNLAQTYCKTQQINAYNQLLQSC